MEPGVLGTGGGGNEYVLPVASDVTLGGVRIGDNIQVSSGGTGIISVAFVPADTVLLKWYRCRRNNHN